VSTPEASRRAVTLLVAAVVLGCGAAPGTVATDVQAYLQRARTWAPVEAEANRTIERILKTQFVDEAEVRRQIADSRPRLLAHIESVRAYKPRAPVLVRIHERYVAAWQSLVGGLDAILSGFDSGDYTRLAKGREAMTGWRRTMLEVASDLRDLMQRYGLDPGGGVRESRAGTDRHSISLQRPGA
jgi:hypothetical protein